MKKRYAQIMDHLQVTDSMRNDVLKAVSEASSSSPNVREAQHKVHRARGWRRGLVAAACAAVAGAACLLVTLRGQISMDRMASLPATSTVSVMETTDQHETAVVSVSSEGNPAIIAQGNQDEGATAAGITVAGSLADEHGAGISNDEQTVATPGAPGVAPGSANTDNDKRPENGASDDTGLLQQVPWDTVPSRVPEQTAVNPVPSTGQEAPDGGVSARPPGDAPTEGGDSIGVSVAPQPTDAMQTMPVTTRVPWPPIVAPTVGPIQTSEPTYAPTFAPATTASASSDPEAIEKPGSTPSPVSTETPWPEAGPTREPQNRPDCASSGESTQSGESTETPSAS